jgi:aspartate carbamoyltransferase catalytic subunit
MARTPAAGTNCASDWPEAGVHAVLRAVNAHAQFLPDRGDPPGRRHAHLRRQRLSTSKGETALDTMRNLEAMGVDCFVVRHADNGAVAALAAGARPETAFINAGDGRSAHPTQGLLDMLTVRRHKGSDFSQLRFAIVGDIRHSRVARTDLHALRALGAGEIRVWRTRLAVADAAELHGCKVAASLDEALAGVDVVMMLRLSASAWRKGLVTSLDDYYAEYGLSPERLRGAAAQAIVMHPGPMNRGVEIADAVADGPQSVILEQVGQRRRRAHGRPGSRPRGKIGSDSLFRLTEGEGRELST